MTSPWTSLLLSFLGNTHNICVNKTVAILAGVGLEGLEDSHPDMGYLSITEVQGGVNGVRE